MQTLAPQQVLLARLTELPVDALRQRVENECMENPWLEHSREDVDGLDARKLLQHAAPLDVMVIDVGMPRHRG